jgi:hypothetical protein
VEQRGVPAHELDVRRREGVQPLAGRCTRAERRRPGEHCGLQLALPLVEQRHRQAGLVPEPAEQVPLPTPAAAATESIDTAEMPRSAKSRSAAWRIAERLRAASARSRRGWPTTATPVLTNRTVVRYGSDA